MSNYSSFWFDRKSSVDDILGYDLDTGIVLDEKPKPKKDHVALARSLVRLSRNSEKRQQLANAGRLRAQDFAWSTIADRVIAYYEELVNESEIGGPYWTQSADLVGTGHPE